MTCPRGCCESYREHVRSIAVSAAALPTRRPDVNRIDATEARWHQDIPAYRRLRKAGVRPRKVDGSAQAERDMGG